MSCRIDQSVKVINIMKSLVQNNPTLEDIANARIKATESVALSYGKKNSTISSKFTVQLNWKVTDFDQAFLDFLRGGQTLKAQLQKYYVDQHDILTIQSL